MVVMQNKILTVIHTVSKLLQSEKQDLSKVSASLKDVYENLKLYGNDFKSVVQLLPILLKAGVSNRIFRKRTFRKESNFRRTSK
jgi:uncharacterized protein (UPF0335 family)